MNRDETLIVRPIGPDIIHTLARLENFGPRRHPFSSFGQEVTPSWRQAWNLLRFVSRTSNATATTAVSDPGYPFHVSAAGRRWLVREWHLLDSYRRLLKTGRPLFKSSRVFLSWFSSATHSHLMNRHPLNQSWGTGQTVSRIRH